MKRSPGRAIDMAKCLVVVALACGFHQLSPLAHGLLNSRTNHGIARIKYLHGSSSSSNQDASPADETRQLIEAQQRQIDQLMELLASKSDGPNGQVASTGTNIALSSLKVMLFIDGTWLYYALNTRDNESCPIQQKYGVGWQQNYSIDWGKLPRIIGRALQQQDRVRGWMPMPPSMGADPPLRPVEVVRVSVYTSFRPDTPKASLRYQMFQEMIKAKYDVLMLETIGYNEKCVDIQLAVDMLHYSTVRDAYDVALLLSGDRDFVPAMVRCRQKGRRVGLISMRGSCTRSFYDTPNIKDYDVIWLDDFLDEILIYNPKPLNGTTPTQYTIPNYYRKRPVQEISEYTIMKVISDFILAMDKPQMSSRVLGRYIKSIRIGGRRILDEVKDTYGGLYQFLVVTEVFVVDTSKEPITFWVGVNESLLSKRLEEAKKKTRFSDAEIRFFESYSAPKAQSSRTYSESPLLESANAEEDSEASKETPDYPSMSLVELKEICREKGLKVTGRKAELIERIQDHDRTASESTKTSSSSIGGNEQVTTLQYLEGLVLEYLHASGGKASSRDVGRYLRANKASPAVAKLLTTQSALSELKNFFGSLRQFVTHSDKFSGYDLPESNQYEFMISLKSPTTKESKE